MKLYLVRHGMEMDGDTIVHGFMDVPLAPLGMEQARAVAESMKGLGIKRIYTSDLTRCVQTASFLTQATGIGMIPDERLRPIKLGELEGRKTDEVLQNLKDWTTTWMEHPKEPVPGGDSFDSFQARNISFFKDIAEHCENDEPVAVFTHSRNCHLVQHWSANNFTPLEKGTENLLHHCDHQLGSYRTYQIDRTSNLVTLKNQGGQKGRSFSMRFIEPGLVRYEDVGDVLVQKPCLDAMAQTFVGCPVFDRTHKDTSETDFTNGKADGIVTRVWTDPSDGWHWCEALVWDPDTILHMTKEGYGLSCAYDVLQWTGQEGSWHNIPYTNEVAKGRYTHLAIVKKPRYEDVRIIANQGGNNMKLMFWKKDQKPEEKPSEVELVNAVTTLDGKDTPLEKVLELAAAELKRQDLANSKKGLDDDEMVEVGGKRMTFKAAKELASTALRNESENSMKSDHDSGKHKEKKMESCGYCSNELANAKAAEAEAKKAEELKNAVIAREKAEADKKAEELRNARAKGEEPKMPDLPPDREDRLKIGLTQYGPLPAANSN